MSADLGFVIPRTRGGLGGMRLAAGLCAALWVCLAVAAPQEEPSGDAPEQAAEAREAERREQAEEAEQRELEQHRQQLMEESCRDELDRPESWLDRTHSYLNRRLCEPAAWFDGFFGDPRSFEETPVGTFLRVRNAFQWDERDDFGYRLRVRANISLPRVSDRLRLLISRDEDLSGDFQDDRDLSDADEDTRLGLRFIASDRARSRLDLDGTIQLSGGALNPRVRARYRHVQGLTSRSLARWTQTAFWERDEGLGTTTRLDWEWLPDRDGLVRLTGQGTHSEESEGVDWRSSLVAFRQLTRRTALRGEIGAFGYTRPSFESEEYFISVRYRRQFLRRWLFFEVQPEHAWPLDPNTGRRRADWRFTFTLEVQFENEPSRQQRMREYSGDEAEMRRWEEDDPVPAGAPGQRRLERAPLPEEEEDEEGDADDEPPDS